MSMRSAPFARAIAMFSAIASAMALPTSLEQRQALDNLGTYQSRGKGGRGHRMQRTVGGRWAVNRSKYFPNQEDAKHAREAA